jgi:hypothetical protein
MAMAVVWKFPEIKAGIGPLPAIFGLAPTFLGPGSTPHFMKMDILPISFFRGNSKALLDIFPSMLN